MILAWSPNPALDITYTLPKLSLGEVHRVTQVDRRAGGKGANVAGALASMGHHPIAVQPLGGPDAPNFLADLAARGITAWTVNSSAPTRHCVVVVVGDEATVLNEAGVPQPESVWRELATLVDSHLAGSHLIGSPARAPGVFAACGSLPPAAPDGIVAELTGLAGERGLHTVLDCRGEALRLALERRPSLVKPNRSEAAETTGHGNAAEAAAALVAMGARAALVSDGAAGLVLVTAGGTRLRAQPGAVVAGNPTGAGDALTAALCAALESVPQLPEQADWWARTLAAGIGWSAAAVAQPTGGVLDPADVARHTAAAVVTSLQSGPLPNGD